MASSENKEAKTGFDLQVAASNTLETDQFRKNTAEVATSRILCTQAEEEGRDILRQRTRGMPRGHKKRPRTRRDGGSEIQINAHSEYRAQQALLGMIPNDMGQGLIHKRVRNGIPLRLSLGDELRQI